MMFFLFYFRYSTSWQAISEGKYRWLDKHRLEVINDENIKLTILGYFGTLAAAIEVPSIIKTTSHGVCGSTNGEWKEDIHQITGAGNQTKVGTLLDTYNQTIHDSFIDKKLRIRSSLRTSMMTKNVFRYTTGAGYMLRFNKGYLTLVEGFSFPSLYEFTIEVWMRLYQNTQHSTGVILSINQDHSVLKVVYKNQIVISWGPYWNETGLVMNGSLWVHLCVTWRSNDGKLTVFLVDTEGDVRTAVFYGIMVNTQFSINRGFVIGSDVSNELTNQELGFDLDELRVWQFSRRTDDVLRTMTVRNKGYIEGLILYCGFDEGHGNITNATL